MAAAYVAATAGKLGVFVLLLVVAMVTGESSASPLTSDELTGIEDGQAMKTQELYQQLGQLQLNVRLNIYSLLVNNE